MQMDADVNLTGLGFSVFLRQQIFIIFRHVYKIGGKSFSNHVHFFTGQLNKCGKRGTLHDSEIEKLLSPSYKKLSPSYHHAAE